MKARFLLLACLGVAAFVSPLAAQTVSSAANQTFAVADPSTTISTITITDAVSPTMTAKNDIAVRIPAALNMTWDATVTTATITGGAALKVSTTVSYANGNKDLLLNLTSNFVGSDQIVVSGLKFANFTAASAANTLGLVVPQNGSVVASTAQTITIVAPTFVGAANQAFTVGDAATAMTTSTITDAATPVITAVKDIRLRIPAALNMVWNTGVTTATIGGAAAAKVSTTVTYEDASKTLVLNVTTDFAAGDQITVAGLQFTSFTAVSAATALQLVVSGTGGGTAATSTTTQQIVAPLSISSAANQKFNVGMALHNISTITVTGDASTQINTTNGIRIRIPTGFGMTWNSADVTATIGGAAAGKVSTTVSYASSDQTLVIAVLTNFAPGDQITISGLQFNNFTAVSATSNLQLATGGAGSPAAATDDKTITVIAAYGISSAANQTFIVNDASTTASAITVTDSGTTPTMTAANDIRIRIPAALNMTWDPTITTATITGAASAKVSATVSYANGNKDLVLNVTTSFVAGDQIVVSGPKFTSFTAPSAAGNLGVIVAGSGGAVVANDDKTKTIVGPTFVGSANQAFTVGDAATAMTSVTITEGAIPTITAANDLRLRIPAALNMVWNTGVTTATIGGAAAGKVSTTVTYEDAGKTVVLNVTSDFAASDQITVAGLQFTSFTAVSPATALQLVVAGTGGATIATSTTTKQIVAPLAMSSAANQMFNVGMALHNISTITITGDASSNINTTNKIRVRIPTGFGMTWNTADVTATIGGAAAAKVSTTVSYENSGQVLVINVTTNFAAGDQITVAGLQFNNFTAVSAASNLQLVLAGSSGGATAATDVKTIAVIARYGMSSAASQTFVVGDPSTTASPITVTDSGTTPTITAKNDFSIVIPAGLNMIWDNSVTTLTITGGAAAKVTTTPTYAGGNLSFKINVSSDFVAGDQIVVSGMKLMTFTAASGPTSLQQKDGATLLSTDDKTKTVVAPAFSESANQIFSVGDAATAMNTATITDNATTPTITATNDLRLRIPAALNMVWNTGVTTATIGGAAAAKVSTTVTYENAGKTLVLNVTSNFAAGDQITVAGLQFTSFTAVSAATGLQLVVSGTGGGTATTSTTTKQIYAAMSMTSAADQIFKVNDASTAMSAITITEDASPSITATNDIRIRIPATFSMIWDNTITTATLAGGAAGKVSTTVTYEDANKTLVLNVTSNFVLTDVLTVSGLKFKSFLLASVADRLQLVVSGTGGATLITDAKTKTVTSAIMSSAANQTFRVSDPTTTMSAITITDALIPTITALNDIRIHIPVAFNMAWDQTVTTATITGGASAKVSTTVSYPNSRTLLLNVTTDFAASNQIVVSGLKFTTFSAASAADHLWLEVLNNAAVTGNDDKFITVIATVYGASVTPDTVPSSRLPSNGTNYTQAFTATNTGNITDSYDLLTTRLPGTALSVVSITGAGVTQGGNPDSARLASLAATGTATVTVTYSVGNVGVGAHDTLLLTARSVGSPAQTDNGRMELTVLGPALGITKEVAPTGTQVPGTDLVYTVDFDNVGSAAAATVVIVDTLPVQVQFKVGSVVSNMPSGVSVAVEYSNNGGSTWTYTPVSAACSAPAGYDGCVNRVRWRLLNTLTQTSPDNSGSVEFTARIR